MVETKYETSTSRIIAMFVDGFMAWIVQIVLTTIWSLGLIPTSGDDLLSSIVNNCSGLGFIIVYSALCHHYTGQTLGKFVTGIKVQRLDETGNLSLSRSFAREIFTAIALLTSLYIWTALHNAQNENDVVLWVKRSRYVFLFHHFVNLLEIATMLSSEKRRSIHDFIAGSVVKRDLTLKFGKSH